MNVRCKDFPIYFLKIKIALPLLELRLDNGGNKNLKSTE